MCEVREYLARTAFELIVDAPQPALRFQVSQFSIADVSNSIDLLLRRRHLSRAPLMLLELDCGSA